MTEIDSIWQAARVENIRAHDKVDFDGEVDVRLQRSGYQSMRLRELHTLGLEIFQFESKVEQQARKT